MKKLLRSFFWLIVLMLVAGSLFFVTCCRAYRIRTGSMEPTVQEGAVVLVLRQDRISQKFTVGEVYAYEKGGLTVIHRLVGTGPDGKSYEFRGDANNISDAGYVSGDRIIGKVILVLP